MANLMLHRDVLKTFGQLPAKVQKQVYELIKRFEDDSTQPAIHLEPVQAARDPKVRSASVGDDFRAIVIAPERGDTFLLMHVDHQDEADRWCRNKQFEAHGALGTLQVFDVQEATQGLTQERDLALAGEARPYPIDAMSDADLYRAGVPEALIPAVRAVHSDESFTQLADYLPPEAGQVLYGIVMGLSLERALAEMLGETGEVAAKPAGPGDFSHLAQAPNLDLVLVEGEEHLRAILSEDFEAWRIFLHPYQRKLVEWRTRGPMKIYGAAGTGKTVALMHRAAWLAHGLKDKERLLVTTYSSNLSVTISALLARLAPDLQSRIEVTNLHQLARTIAYRCGWRGKIAEDGDRATIWDQVLTPGRLAGPGFDQTFVMGEFDQIIDRMGIDSEDAYLTTVRSGRPRLSREQRRQLWTLFTGFQRELARRDLLTFEGVVHQARLAVEQGRFQRYRHVLVDELQDFGLEALRLIRALSPFDEGTEDPLCVVGDGHQRIYNRVPAPLSRAGIDVRGRSRRLKINYRTSEQIRRWAQALLQGVAVDDLDGGVADTTGDRSVFRGPEPKVVACDSAEAVGVAVTEWVSGLLAEGYRSHDICLTPGETHAVAALESAGIPTLELKPRQRDPGQDEAGVRYGSKARIKGLEFRAVAVVLGAQWPDDLDGRFANYVAATRARERLLVASMG